MYSTFPRLDAYRLFFDLWETWQDWLAEYRQLMVAAQALVTQGSNPWNLEKICVVQSCRFRPRSSNNAFASFRSAVSNPSVNQW